MSIHLSILGLSILWLCSCSQPTKSIADNIVTDIVNSTKRDIDQRSLNPDLEKYIYTDTTYRFSIGNEVTIQNSYPKGGSIASDGTQYYDSTGKRYAFSVFWTRIINESDTPLDVNINFPADSFTIFTPPDSYLKLLLPSDTITMAKLPMHNYGLTEMEAFLNSNFHKATKLQKTIAPNEEHIFYVVALSYIAVGTPRAALILKDQDLYYNMSIAPKGSGTIPCGKISFKGDL